jgi:hypothetical protein
VPIYAIVPTGGFASDIYRWLVAEWSDPDVELVAVPGMAAGQLTLYDGVTVDILVPDLRGMHSWETTRYVTSLVQHRVQQGNIQEDQAKKGNPAIPRENLFSSAE